MKKFFAQDSARIKLKYNREQNTLGSGAVTCEFRMPS